MAADSRQEILASIRRNLPQAAPLPGLDEEWIEFDDPRQQFQSVLELVGGSLEVVADRDELNARLQELPVYSQAAKVVSVVEGVGRCDVDLETLDDPHLLEDVDLSILNGRLAVAENGAVWVDDRDLKHRVLYFLPQHIALVVPADRLLHNLHQAYGQIELGQRGFGAFISGPSKTADIEQSLVIGAHGARSLTVFLVERL